MKNLPDKLKQQVLDKNSYADKGGLTCKELSLQNDRRLLVNYSEKRARKDAHDRQSSIDKLIKKTGKSKNPESFISNHGYRKYIKIESSQEVEIDQNKIEEAKKWDGLHGVITNIKDMQMPTVFDHYKGLWQVEESFRLTKHDLQVRPIYHWTPQRIKAHVALCFMALTCIRHLSYRVGLQYQKLSPEIIRTELTHVQISILKHQATNQRYAIPSRITQHSRKIYHAMGEKLSDVPFVMD